MCELTNQSRANHTDVDINVFRFKTFFVCVCAILIIYTSYSCLNEASPSTSTDDQLNISINKRKLVLIAPVTKDSHKIMNPLNNK